MKTILISGGSDGLGKALAQELSREHQVIILSHNEEKTSAAADEIGCDYVTADLTKPGEINTAITHLIEKYKKINCLINNAGVWIQGSLETNETTAIQNAMAVNATGTILLTHAVLPYMKKEKSGRIINVISQAGLTAKAERSVYHASKWAITGFTKSLAEELKDFGIGVTGFYPGSIKTNLFKKVGVEKDMSRYMELEDVVRALKFVIDTPEELTIPEIGIKPVY